MTKIAVYSAYKYYRLKYVKSFSPPWDKELVENSSVEFIYWVGQKVHLDFSIRHYGKIQMNFLAIPTLFLLKMSKVFVDHVLGLKKSIISPSLGEICSNGLNLSDFYKALRW